MLLSSASFPASVPRPVMRVSNVPSSIRPIITALASATSVFLVSVDADAADWAAEWAVPMAGNTFQTAPKPGGNGAQQNGPVAWSDRDAVFSVFFRVDRPAQIHLALNAATRNGQSIIATRIDRQKFQTVIKGPGTSRHDIGVARITEPGYVRVDLQGIERTGDVFAEITELLLSSNTDGLTIDFVQNNKGNMYYWGRRGPSVHLRYQVPENVDLRYAYSEVTVPSGQDPIGTFYMANGFGQGYFGMQVNSSKERRILFSVWSPFRTDNPRDIPPEQRIVPLAKGTDVHVGEFGNEGSGGQSYLVYPWTAGSTCQFLTRVEPDDKGRTTYTSWFSEVSDDRWRLIASFRRPSTQTHLKGFHSFLESFSPSYGHLGRRAFYGNVWVCDVNDHWHACSQARFSVDATGGRRHRLDFNGGSDGTRFFLRNCGFFNETGQPGAVFRCDVDGEKPPEISFDALPLK